MVVLSDGSAGGVKANIPHPHRPDRHHHVRAGRPHRRGMATRPIPAGMQTRRWPRHLPCWRPRWRQAFLVEYDSPRGFWSRRRAIDLPKDERIVTAPRARASFELCATTSCDDHTLRAPGVGSRFPLAGAGTDRRARCALAPPAPPAGPRRQLGGECLASMTAIPVTTPRWWPCTCARGERDHLDRPPATRPGRKGRGDAHEQPGHQGHLRRYHCPIAARVLGRELKVDWLRPAAA